MAAFEAVHRTILVFDIEQSNHPYGRTTIVW
jgi:hypothetical protein